MSPSISTLLSIGLVASAAIAAPTASDTEDVSCPGWYLVEKWGRVVAQPSWNSSRIGSFQGCQPVEDLVRRDDPFTKVEPGDGKATATHPNGDEAPETTLWNMDVAGALCGGTYCDPEKSISVDTFMSSPSSDYVPLVLTLDGNFPDSTLRDAMISLVKTAFFKGVIATTDPSGLVHYSSFPNYLHITTKQGDASGYYLTARLEDQIPDTPGCPSWVGMIGQFISLAGEEGALLGTTAQVLCQ